MCGPAAAKKCALLASMACVFSTNGFVKATPAVAS